MNRILSCFLVAVASLATGCFELEDTIRVNADGSGEWKYKMTLGPRLAAMRNSSGDGFKFNGNLIAQEEELRAAVAGIRGAKLVAFKLEEKEGSVIVNGHIQFADIVEVYRNGQFKEQFNWSFRKDGDRLVASIRDGMMSQGGENDLTKQMDFKKLGELAPEAACAVAGVKFRLPLGPKVALPLDPKQFTTDDAGIRDGMANVKLTPASARLFRHTKYDTGNRVFYGNAPLELTMTVKWPGTLRPIGWSQLTLEHGVDDRGKKLTQERRGVKPDKVNELRRKSRDKNASDIVIRLSEPTRNADKFSLKGSLLLHAPKKVTTVKIPNIKNHGNKVIEHPALGEMGLKLKHYRTGSVELVAEQPTDAVIEVKLMDPELTRELHRYHMSRSHFWDEHRLRASFQSSGRSQIENPTLVLEVGEGIERVAVPFEFENLKMP